MLTRRTFFSWLTGGAAAMVGIAASTRKEPAPRVEEPTVTTSGYMRVLGSERFNQDVYWEVGPSDVIEPGTYLIYRPT